MFIRNTPSELYSNILEHHRIDINIFKIKIYLQKKYAFGKIITIFDAEYPG